MSKSLFCRLDCESASLCCMLRMQLRSNVLFVWRVETFYGTKIPVFNYCFKNVLHKRTQICKNKIQYVLLKHISM